MTRLPPFGSWLMDHVHSRYSKYNQTCKQKMKYLFRSWPLLKSAPPILRIKYKKRKLRILNIYLLFLLCGHVWSATPMRDGCVVHILRTCSYRIARTHRSTMFVDDRSIPPSFDFATVLDMAETNLWQKTILSHSFFWSTRLTCFIDNLITILKQIFIKKIGEGERSKENFHQQDVLLVALCCVISFLNMSYYIIHSFCLRIIN